MQKKPKTYKQRDTDEHLGKMRYRVRKQQEQEAEKEMKEFNVKITN